MEDVIYRKAAIDALVKDCKASDEGMLNMYDIVCDLRDVPPAQPERKRGKWIEAYDPFNRISGRCSVCGWEAHLYEDDVVGMNYCPN